jgi:hypothetical protein
MRLRLPRLNWAGFQAWEDPAVDVEKGIIGILTEWRHRRDELETALALHLSAKFA